MLGLFGMVVINFKAFSKKLVEEFSVDVYFKTEVTENKVREIQRWCESQPWYLRSTFIDRNMAMQQLAEKEGDEFMTFVNAAALPLSIELRIKSEYNNPNQLKQISITLKKMHEVDDVMYQANIIDNVQSNLRTLQWVMLGVALVFVFISVGLINSTVRLNMFANRFLIKSMQLVGATSWFITKPMLLRFSKYAFISSIISSILMAALVFAIIQLWMPEYLDLINFKLLPFLYTSILIFGVFLALICAWFSTRKYLRTKIENLY